MKTKRASPRSGSNGSELSRKSTRMPDPESLIQEDDDMRSRKVRYTCQYVDIDADFLYCGVEHQSLANAVHCSRMSWQIFLKWDIIKVRWGFYKKMEAKGGEINVMPRKLDAIEKSLL